MLYGLPNNMLVTDGMPWFFCTLLLPNSPKKEVFHFLLSLWNTGFWHLFARVIMKSVNFVLMYCGNSGMIIA